MRYETKDLLVPLQLDIDGIEVDAIVGPEGVVLDADVKY